MAVTPTFSSPDSLSQLTLVWTQVHVGCFLRHSPDEISLYVNRGNTSVKK